MKRSVKIVNEGVKFDKKKYEGVFGDYDKDGVVNIDDANPTDKNKKGKVEPVPASETFNKLLELKAELDKVMEDSVDILKEKTPKDADIYARTKTPYSIIKKLVEKRLMHPEKGLQDLVGTTIAVDSYEDLIEVRNKIRKGTLGEVIEEEDMYSNPKQGYMAYHYIVKVGKIPVEVQLKTKRMKDVNELTHEPYKTGTVNVKNALALAELVAKADKGDKKAIAEYNSKMKDKSALKRSLDTSKMAKGGAIKYATKWSEKSPYSITVYEKDGEKIHLTYLSKDGVNQFKKKFPKAVVSIGKVDKDGTITDEYAKGGTVEEMNTELAKKDYSNNKINVKRRFYTTKNGKLMVKETATGRRTTPRKLIRHLLHESYTGNTKYAELDNGTHFIEDSKGKLHPIYDASARQKGSVTEYYQGDIDDYSEYEVMVELEVKPSKIYEKNKKLVKGGEVSSKKNGGKVETKNQKRRKEIKELWDKYNYNPYQLEGGFGAGEKPNTIAVTKYGYYNSLYLINDIIVDDEFTKLLGSEYNGGVIIDVFSINSPGHRFQRGSNHIGYTLNINGENKAYVSNRDSKIGYMGEQKGYKYGGSMEIGDKAKKEIKYAKGGKTKSLADLRRSKN